MSVRTIAQTNALMRVLPRFSPPTVSTPYLTVEIQSGDTTTTLDGAVTGYPIPTTSRVMLLGGVPAGTFPYTTSDADIGKTLQYKQIATATAVASAVSTLVTVIAKQSAVNQSLIGTNTTGVTNYTLAQYLNNAGLQTSLFFYPNTSNPLVASDLLNGWPKVAFQCYFTQAIGGFDGQLDHTITYHCSIPSQTTVPSANGSCTITNVSLTNPTTGINDGVNTWFTFTFTAASNPSVAFSGGIPGPIDIPRDGVTSTIGGPEFLPAAITHFAKFGCIRFMDMCNANGCGDINWGDRLPDYGTNSPRWPYSQERIIRFMLAVLAAPGSKVKKLWFNLPGLATPAYGASLAALMNSMGLSQALEIEVGNEWWNFSGPSFNSSYYPTGANQFTYAFQFAQNEAQVACTSANNYGEGNSANCVSAVISSATATGGVVTVTCTAALPSFITNGAQVVIYAATPAWSGTSSIAAPITVTVPGSNGPNSFNYSAAAATGTLNLALTSGHLAVYFNLASTLVTDGISLDLNQIWKKYYVRSVYNIQQAWAAVRPNDRFVLGCQIGYGVNSNVNAAQTGILNNPSTWFQYAAWLASGQSLNGGNSATPTLASTWLHSAAVAPYIKASIGFNSAAVQAGPSAILGVACAATCVVGDSITVSGIGTAGAAVTTTVAAGSSGTTLMIAAPVTTAVTNGSITYISGDGGAICNALIAQANWLMPLYAQSHAYECVKYGLSPVCYEMGPDTTGQPTNQVDINTNVAMGTLISTMYDYAYGCGLDETYWFSAIPAFLYQPYAYSGWGVMNSYTDTTSVKIAAIEGYTKQRVYANGNTSGGHPVCLAVNVICGIGGGGMSAASGEYYWPSGTTVRTAEWPIVINRSGRYAIVATMNEQTPGTVASVYLDNSGTPLGTTVITGTGSGNAASPSPADCTPIIADLTSGRHNLKLSLPSSAGGIAGLVKVIVLPIAS